MPVMPRLGPFFIKTYVFIENSICERNSVVVVREMTVAATSVHPSKSNFANCRPI